MIEWIFGWNLPYFITNPFVITIVKMLLTV